MSFDYGDNSTFMKEQTRATPAGRPAPLNRAGYGANGTNTGSADNFSAQQRVRLQLDAVASESLSGTVYFEIGNQVWGRGNQGAALGADGLVVEVRRAYIDWIVPNTDLKVRMGIQGFDLPSMTFGASEILNADAPGIVLSNKFNDNVALTALWMRPFNDNFPGRTAPSSFGGNAPAGYMDNADFFALLLPLTFDGVKVTPWAMVGFTGPNTLSDGAGGLLARPAQMNGEGFTMYTPGMMPAYSVWNRDNGAFRNTEYATSFFAGLTGEVTMWDPFRLAWDLNYGGVSYEKQTLSRSGWVATLLGEYKLDWATPGLYFWYGSGDDSNPKNGSERMATVDPNGTNQMSTFGLSGDPFIGRDAVLSYNHVGTWGIGGRLKDMSFLEGLKHTFRINYYGGTNSPEMAKYILGKKTASGNPVRVGNLNVTDFNSMAANNGLYLTTMDSALEFGLSNTYKIYENLTMLLDANYIALWLDQSKSVWGGVPAGWYGTNRAVNGISTTDAWNVNVSFTYEF